ncbi:MAG: ABC-F family ATP-binding cassette domain-containing protein [Clostridia bacterium]|nr:ABC-F family ATP-binding cassette domain-containing protein [Clostridia bacterium]
MILLSLQGVTKSFGTNEVLRDASLVLQDGQRMGLVGVNGCGKSTLMKIIAGIESSDGGVITMQKGLKLGYLAQQGDVGEGRTVLEELESVFDPVVKMEQQMRQLEQQMAEVGSDEMMLRRLGSQYDQLTRDFERANGYGWRSTVQGVLAGLGFRKEQQHQLASLLSGGERTRLCLGRMLLTEPDLLLLDEPTNHLDLKSIAWLENYLRNYRGAVLLISHDRYFMDHVCDRMCELLLGTTECYDGNYTSYMAQRTERFEIRMKAWELQQKEIARQEAIIARYRQFNREKSIKLAESREKRLEKIERLEKPKDESAIRFRFDIRRRTGEDVMMVEGLSKGYDGRTLFRDVKMHLRAGDRVALIGDNGVGKSTLFKCLIGEEKADAGTVRMGSGVEIGYYDQHQAHLHNDKTVLDEVWDDFRRLDQTEVRGALGLFLFTGDEVLMPVSTLSGGEKGRVALTKLMLRKDNVLLLDEPTNHLDMDSREVLEDALENFPGTILAISHDRYFINRFAGKVCVLEQGGIKEYLGNYDDYFEKINREQEPDGDTAGMTRTAIEKEKRKSRDEERRLKERKLALKAAEAAVLKAEEEAAELEAKLADPDTYADADKAARLAKEYQLKKDEIEELYQAWEELEMEE